MTQSFENSIVESVTQSEPDLLQLKRQIQTSFSTLKQINNVQEFVLRVLALNSKAKSSIECERIKQGLIYLNEAEKILEYAVSSGKIIDKNILISLLHNHASCYQKSWELEKCSQYLEAIIFNFNSDNQTRTSVAHKYQKQKQRCSRQTTSKTRQSVPIVKSLKKLDQIIENEIFKQTLLAKYYLQYSASTSQLSNHSGALIAGKKSIEMMREIFKHLGQHPILLKKGIYQKKIQFQLKTRLIQVGSKFTNSMDISKYDKIVKAAKFYINYWKSMKFDTKLQKNHILEDQYKSYTFTNIMQIQPIIYKDLQQSQSKILNVKNILQKILLFALGYFTVSTQLRMIASKKTKLVRQLLQFQAKQSEIYLLMSIILVTACVPFDILFINHLISSYCNHFNKNLFEEKEQTSQEFAQITEEFFPRVKFLHMRPRKELSGTSFDTQETDNKNQSNKTNSNSNSNKPKKKSVKKKQSKYSIYQTQNSKKKCNDSSKTKSVKSKNTSKQSRQCNDIRSSRELLSPKEKSSGSSSKIVTKKGRISIGKLSNISKNSEKQYQQDIESDYFIKEEKKKIKSPKPQNNPIKSFKSPQRRQVSNNSQQKTKNALMKSVKSPKKILNKKIKDSLNSHYL